jgi:predicted amidohydrolase
VRPTGDVQVAISQLDAEPFDVEANAVSGAQAIAAAARGGADIVVLPELLSTGYVMDRARIHALAEPVGAGELGPALGRWTRAAAEAGVAVVAGFAERGPAGCYNSAVAIDRAGAIVEVYRKTHLFDAERSVFEPGDRGLPIVTLAGVAVGILICYDLRFPEALRILALRGAELVCVPTAWVSAFDGVPSPCPGFIPQVLNATVQANLDQVWVAAAGRTGEDDGVTLLGNSVIVDPYGSPVAGPLGREPGLVIHPVRPALAPRPRRCHPAARGQANRSVRRPTRLPRGPPRAAAPARAGRPTRDGRRR